ncbi:hypothetical protein M5K25_015560 [Dendrobium thyrsiflorum]|uniref:Glycosyltransferase n=1 Tax=Dendrobium thyrsiflorum TaxID=117978 RepID=A0ABD0UXZ3_DENTH
MAAHAVIFTFPAQGNASPMLKLAELLSLANIHITFLNTESIHHRFLRHSPDLDRLARLPCFRFRTIPDGLPEDHPRPILDFLNLLRSLNFSSREPYKEILAPASGIDPDGWPQVTCVIADGTLSLAYEVPAELGLPVIFFRTSSACSFWAYHCVPLLLRSGELPFPEGADMDQLVQNVPGMETILRRRDLPGFCVRARTADDPALQFVARSTADVAQAQALLFNTMESLEGPTLSLITRSVHKNTYAVGPLHALLTFFSNEKNSANLWEQDHASIAWLDAQPRRSVVYVSFGSVAVVSKEQLVEFWNGLVNSGYRFLWVVRKDLLGDAADGAEVVGEVERGKVVGWAPQEEVLAHPAVGCFLTHSGWNSTLESLAVGVPMVCWPFFADQLINSRFVEKVWGVGLDMKDVCRREVVERMVREVMEGEKAEEMRRAAGKMAEEVRRSVGEEGSSRREFTRLVEDIKAMSVQVLKKKI